MKFKKRKKNKPEQKWLSTYADMITLVLVFFVLLFSISQIDAEKFQTVAQSYRDRVIFDFQPSIVPGEYPSEMGDTIDNPDGDVEDFNKGPNKDDQGSIGDQLDAGQDSDTGVDDKSYEEWLEKEDRLGRLMDEVDHFLEAEGLEEVITANRTERGVVLVLSERILFETGEADIIEEGRPFLDKVGKLLQQIPNYVKVEGHTDSRPISTYRYPSNWELSTARASSVIRYFIDEHSLPSERFQSSGFADTKPVAPNDTPENLQKNRRVEIVILEVGNETQE